MPKPSLLSAHWETASKALCRTRTAGRDRRRPDLVPHGYRPMTPEHLTAAIATGAIVLRLA
ncbi:hypothetical protein AA13595_1159 [Gluconacetobacter johannae DSM 13595]|nr:hypothetical protein AA13595_1159 [Gluconacetobacter johannae DSM 13595]